MWVSEHGDNLMQLVLRNTLKSKFNLICHEHRAQGTTENSKLDTRVQLAILPGHRSRDSMRQCMRVASQF